MRIYAHLRFTQLPLHSSYSILENMKQVLIIHGGNSFSSYDEYRSYLQQKQLDYSKLTNRNRWKENLSLELPDHDVIYPTMPNNLNAVYEEWAVYMQKLLEFLKDDVQMVGHSLGAMFLAKYLNEHQLKRPVRRLILVAGAFDDESMEDLGSFRVSSVKNLPKSANEIHLFHSKDDPVVPFSELTKFQTDLPNAVTHIFEDRGHFNDTTFPELLELLKQK